MVKYVLNSGGVSNNAELAKKFFAEVAKGLGDAPKILLCFFAQKREEWEGRFSSSAESLKGYMPEAVQPTFELALPETFEAQIRSNDAVYIPGGDDHLVQYWLKQFSIPEIWDGKVVATNSASSHALSTQFWSCDWRMCMNGLGVLPIKFLAHYESQYGADDPRGPIDWQGAYKELEGFGDTSLPIHALREGNFIVLER